MCIGGLNPMGIMDTNLGGPSYPICVKVIGLFECFVNKRGASFLNDASARFYLHPDDLREFLEESCSSRVKDKTSEEKLQHEESLRTALGRIGVNKEFHLTFYLGSEGAVFSIYWDDTLDRNQVVMRF
ncbi:hypothetical protein LCGC14_0963440 [marine sediment metagenome]|uniref:Uncharacterized protein n=1 Tax=marine sediment metagenome TaxID=412755 RepID=A0A0F9NDW2_9ZZZZ